MKVAQAKSQLTDLTKHWMQVELRDEAEVRSVRREFDRVRNIFRQNVLNNMPLDQLVQLSDPKNWADFDALETHHQLPISLGGGNDFSNLVMIPKALHRAIHTFLGDQTKGMATGESRVIEIPWINANVYMPKHETKRVAETHQDSTRALWGVYYRTLRQRGIGYLGYSGLPSRMLH